MSALEGVHLGAIAIWFLSAGFDVGLEIVLRWTRSADLQRSLIELHRKIDVWIEGPAVIVTVVSGAALLRAAGLVGGELPWPGWLEWKVASGLIAATANLACVAFVLARARAARAAPEPTPRQIVAVRRWSAAIWLTGLGVPFALGALALGVWH
ncbi:MAG: hypothetical protein HYY06_09935 [Deltaproteobacteria bacterium]|nr:hypothetical protein [Deltaproteobacteria bacterium]